MLQALLQAFHFRPSPTLLILTPRWSLTSSDCHHKQPSFTKFDHFQLRILTCFHLQKTVGNIHQHRIPILSSLMTTTLCRPHRSLGQAPAQIAHLTASLTSHLSQMRRRSRMTMALVSEKSLEQPRTVQGWEACPTGAPNQHRLLGGILFYVNFFFCVENVLNSKLFRDPTPSPSPYIAPSPGGLPLPSPGLPLPSPSALVTTGLPCPTPLSPLSSPPPPSPLPPSPTKLKKQAKIQLESSDEEEDVRTPAVVKSKSKPVSEKKKTPIRRKSSKSSNFKSNATISDDDSDSDAPAPSKRSLSTSPAKRPKPSPVQGRNSRPSSTHNTPVRGGRGSSSSGPLAPPAPLPLPTSSAPPPHHSSPMKRSQVNVSSNLHLSADSDDDEEEEMPKAAVEKPSPAPDTVKKNSIKSRIFGPMLSKVLKTMNNLLLLG